jgi:hypothetical protein
MRSSAVAIFDDRPIPGVMVSGDHGRFDFSGEAMRFVCAPRVA